MVTFDEAPSKPPARFAKLKRLAPYLLLGPITGPLCAAMVHHYRAGRPVLATLYGIAMVEIIVLLPVITASLGLKIL
jgi:hypothetical protein